MKNHHFLLLAGWLLAPVTGHAQNTLLPDSLYGTNAVRSVHTGQQDIPRRILDAGNNQFIYAGHTVLPGFSENIVLYKADRCGAPVASFGTGGTASYGFPNFRRHAQAESRDFALQPNGQIVVAGVHGNFAASQALPGVFRFNADGSPDLAFGDSGVVSRRYDNISSGVHQRVFVLPNGRILAAGVSVSNINGGTPGLAAMRFFANGRLDTTYGGGTGQTRRPADVYGYAGAERLSNGKLVVLATLTNPNGFTGKLAMVRFDSTGVLDATFGTNGYAEFPSIVPDGTFGFSTAVQTDDKILVAYCHNGDANGYVARFRTNGTLDPTYGTAGIKTLAPPAGIDFVQPARIRLDASGRALVSGQLNSNFAQRNQGFIARLTPAGALDATFCTTGIYTMPSGTFGGGAERFLDVLPLPAMGHWLAFGDNTQEWRLTRLTPTSNVPHVTYAFPLLTTTGTGTYQWHFNGAPIAGATARTYQPTQLGTYVVVLTDATGCSYMSAPVTVTRLNGLADDVSGRRLELRPNPATDYVRLTMGSPAPPAPALLFDALGRVARRYALPATDEATLDLRGLPPGLYLLRAGERTARLVVE